MFRAWAGRRGARRKANDSGTSELTSGWRRRTVESDGNNTAANPIRVFEVSVTLKKRCCARSKTMTSSRELLKVVWPPTRYTSEPAGSGKRSETSATWYACMMNCLSCGTVNAAETKGRGRLILIMLVTIAWARDTAQSTVLIEATLCKQCRKSSCAANRGHFFLLRYT